MTKESKAACRQLNLMKPSVSPTLRSSKDSSNFSNLFTTTPTSSRSL